MSAPAACEPRRPRDRIWNLATWVLLAVLMAGSVLAGLRWRSDVARERAAVFQTTASAVASSVATTLSRQTDLVTAEQALVRLNPNLTNTEFAQWFDDLGASERADGGLGFGFVERVPAAELTAFASQLAADPTAALKIAGHYQVMPAGNRPQYCLARLTRWLGPNNQLPPTLDYCAPSLPLFGPSPTAAALVTARDTGKLTFTPPVGLYPGVMFAFLPVYAGNSTPTTVADRNQRLVGWVAGTFDGTAIIAAAVAGHPDLHVEVTTGTGADRLTLASDGRQTKRQVSSLTVPIDRAGTWSVQVSGTPVAGGVSASKQGLVFSGLGIVISLLIFGVIQVLLRSRGRALRLVRERTEELRHRAMHDDLTGLPNRALIMDRIEQMLHRARRHHTAAAVMYVDLDRFKDVNDTHGHAVGDALLCAFAARLSGALRDTDTAGRIGGDEFIVLVEGDSLDDGAATVAARLLDVLHQPFTLDELPGVALEMRASIGVALVGAGTPDDVLRNADIALYEAKAAGKSQFTVFAG